VLKPKEVYVGFKSKAVFEFYANDFLRQAKYKVVGWGMVPRGHSYLSTRGERYPNDTMQCPGVDFERKAAHGYIPDGPRFLLAPRSDR
jgi:hypothetical protein